MYEPVSPASARKGATTPERCDTVTEVVADPEGQESSAEPTTPPEEDVATIKKRLAGKDQALTAAQQRAKDLEARATAAERRLAEKEQADMSELERAQQRAEQAEAAAAKARQEALIARLAAKHPRGYPLYEDLMKVQDDPEQLIGFLEGLAAAKMQAAESEEEPSVNLADRPRKQAPNAGKMTEAQLTEH